MTIGATGIELDARRTADGALVVHHDAHLPDGRPIVECHRDDLPEWLPVLPEALDACAGAFVNIEIKNDAREPDFDPDDIVAEAVMSLLAARSEPASNWLISSFRIETVDRCRAIDAAVATAWLTAGAVGDREVADVAGRGHAAIHPWDPTVDAATIERCHAAGLRVNTWTCNDAVRAGELSAWGIDGICTDIPGDILEGLMTA